MFKVPEKYRLKEGEWASPENAGNFGVFFITLNDNFKSIAKCIASDGLGWEHVSVHIWRLNKSFTPSWKEMCFIKDLFWGEEDCVLQIHPPKSEYVNMSKNCLHLWRSTEKEFSRPQSILVGYTDEQLKARKDNGIC